jgi:hypothetical protein
MTFREMVVCPLFLVLAGCASLSEKQCRSGDWAGIGRADGEKGLAADELERHQKACVEHGVKPDAQDYRAGYAQGLQTYCMPGHGYVAARRGEGYREVCPAPATKFLEAFRRGREVSLAIRDVAELRRSLQEVEVAAMSGDHSDEERTQLRYRAHDLSQKVRMREWDVERLDRTYAARFDAPQLTWEEMRDWR